MPEVDIEWLTLGGEGGGRANGRVYQVPGALPGDQVRCEVRDKPRGRITPATLVEVVQRSEHRRDHPCPHSDTCGGCDLGQMDPAGRRASIATAIGRALRVPPPPVIHEPSGGRARIKLAIRDGEVGYLQPRSHTLVPVTACGVARPEVSAAIRTLRAWVQTHPEAPGIQSVEVRSDGTRVAYDVQTLPDTDRAARAALRKALAPLEHVAVNGHDSHGCPTLSLPVGGLHLRASPSTFFQVDLELNGAMVSHVTELVASANPEAVLDLYAGIGNFTVAVGRATGAPVVSVENHPAAVKDLTANAATHAVRATPVRADVERYRPSNAAFDVAIVDPPRRGCGRSLSEVLACRPRFVVYVACNPSALVTDLRSAERQGYDIDSVRCFDLFPDTHHIETVVRLARTRRPQRVKRR